MASLGKQSGTSTSNSHIRIPGSSIVDTRRTSVKVISMNSGSSDQNNTTLVSSIMRRFHFLILGGPKVGKLTFMQTYLGNDKNDKANNKNKGLHANATIEKQIEVPEKATIILHR